MMISLDSIVCLHSANAFRHTWAGLSLRVEMNDSLFIYRHGLVGFVYFPEVSVGDREVACAFHQAVVDAL